MGLACQVRYIIHRITIAMLNVSYSFVISILYIIILYSCLEELNRVFFCKQLSMVIKSVNYVVTIIVPPDVPLPEYHPYLQEGEQGCSR